MKRPFIVKVLFASLLSLLLTCAFAAPHACAQVQHFMEDLAEPATNIRFQLTPFSDGNFTVYFDYQNANNSYLFQIKNGTAAFQSLIDGKLRLLASHDLPSSDNLQITIIRRPKLMQAVINEKVLLTAYDATFTHGKIGFSTSGGWKWQDALVQPVNENFYFADDFTRVPGSGHQWAINNGNWRLTASSDSINTSNQNMSANPFSYRVQSSPTLASTTAGKWFWGNYQAQVSVKPQDAAGKIGLACYVQDAQNYIAFIWSGQNAPAAKKLVLVQNGKPSVLASAAGAFFPNQWYQLRLRTMPGYVEAFIDGRQVFRIKNNRFGQGGIGLLTQNTAANFDDAKVETNNSLQQHFNPTQPAPHVAPQMSTDSKMVEWASPAAQWSPRKTEQGLEFWNDTEFLGDYAVGYQWDIEKDTNLELSLRANENDFGSGYLLRCDVNHLQLQLDLLLDGKVLQSNIFNLTAITTGINKSTFMLTAHLIGNAILVTVNNRTVLTWQPSVKSTFPQGTHLAARSRDMLRPRALSVQSFNRDEYTFTKAPVDWYSLQGAWSVFSRWPCYNDWSFFGGKGTAPVIWNKRQYKQNLIVVMYAHNQMDLPKEIGYSHPGDLNITLFGDGINRSSGYSFVIGGWYNTRSAILKGNQIVASSSADSAVFSRPISQYSPFHKGWAKVHVEAKSANQNGEDGILLRLIFNDKEIVRFFDADPLPAFSEGGKVAIWTAESSMMLARVDIENEHPGKRHLPDGLIYPTEKVLLRTGNENELIPQAISGSDGIKSTLVTRTPKDSWDITNLKSGGIFAVSFQQADNSPSPQSPLILSEESHIAFDVKISPNVHVDLYLTINGQEFLVPLSGQQKKVARVPILTNTTFNANSNQWQHINLDLGKVLSRLSPDATTWKLQAIRIGALHGDYYRWLGFDGNHYASHYQLKQMRIVP